MEQRRGAKACGIVLLVGVAAASVSACGDDAPQTQGGGGNAGDAGSGGSAASTPGGAGEAGEIGGTEAGAGGGVPELPGCDDALKEVDLGPNATVTLVHAFQAGDALSLDSLPQEEPLLTPVPLCLVKLMVGPGNPGPEGAPSTSAGIGIEVWLPTRDNWNGRYQALGNGGFAGGADIASLTRLGALRPGPSALLLAGDTGYVTSINDGGHTGFDGAFAMMPDGELNTASLVDFGERATHEMALKTKALIAAFYGKNPMYSYFQGCSEGGREALMEVQRYPNDFDGVVAGAPPLSLSLDDLWPQVVMRVDLGGPLAVAKLELVTAAANAACSPVLTGEPDGYITEPADCKYDPTTDAAVLCTAAGGSSTSPACLTLAEATAVNKIWYGPTLTGAVPSPAVDNGRGALGALAQGQLAFGPSRGTVLAGHPFFGGVAGEVPTPLPLDVLALALGDSAFAAPSFQNATGNGQDQWQSLDYAAFAEAYQTASDTFDELVGVFEPDLSAFAARKGKLLLWHGTADSLVPSHGTVRYYESVAQAAGGYAEAQKFARFYLAPGFDHCFGAGTPGTNPPAPGGEPGNGMFSALQTWVEDGQGPEQLAARSAMDVVPERTRPWCLYPKRLKYVSGDVNSGNFTCE